MATEYERIDKLMKALAGLISPHIECEDTDIDDFEYRQHVPSAIIRALSGVSDSGLNYCALEIMLTEIRFSPILTEPDSGVTLVWGSVHSVSKP